MSFKTLTELKRHNIAEHSNRPYACPHCPHRSKTKDKLDRHLLCHSGPRESYQCQHCEKKFVFKNSLKKHLEKGRCDVLKQQKRIKLIKTEEDKVSYQKDVTKISGNESTNGGVLQKIDFDLLRGVFKVSIPFRVEIDSLTPIKALLSRKMSFSV